MNAMPLFRSAMTLLMIGAMTGCQQLPMVQSPSGNFNARVNHLIIHFTSENFGESLRILTGSVDRPVSAHYLLRNQVTQRTISPHWSFMSLYRLNLEPGTRRFLLGWKTGLNDQSIGIEIVNESRCSRALRHSLTAQL